jgi:hypothetical protein
MLEGDTSSRRDFFSRHGSREKRSFMPSNQRMNMYNRKSNRDLQGSKNKLSMPIRQAAAAE